MQYSSSLLFLLLLFIQFGIFCLAQNPYLGCIQRERNALLNFKTSFVDPFNKLASWNDTEANCCIWEGVSCNEITGHVIILDLRCNPYEHHQWCLQSKHLDSSILELKFLNYLDLSFNNFNGSTIPTFLGSMEELRYLNLSRANFTGIVPHHLGNLSNLRTLDLHGFPRPWMVSDLGWASNLSLLEHFDLGFMFLRPTEDLIKVFNKMPSLVMLGLSYSSLSNDHLSHACVKNFTLFSSVQHLDLSGNSFYGEFPCFLRNMTSLSFLNLSANMYNASDPYFLTSINLVNVDLSENQLGLDTNWISKFTWDKCHLKSLNLNLNKFHGDISLLFNNLSRCWSHNVETLSLIENELSGSIPSSIGNLSSLEVLEISDNMLSGVIPLSIGNLSSLEVLEISSNMLSGVIPSSIGNLSFLEVLKISYNMLSGPIPSSIGNLRELKSLNIKSNQLNGTISEAHFVGLSKLERVYVGSNLLNFQFQSNWVPPFQLKELMMGSSDVGGQFPKWLLTQKALIYLDLSNCSISGSIPNYLQSMMNLEYLRLPNNRITGTIPQLPSTLSFLDLFDNMISLIPSNIGHMLPHLQFLSLGRNSIHGSIPNSLCKLEYLLTLEISNNYLSGNLLDCWQNFLELEDVELSSNNFSGTIPESMGHISYLSFLLLDNNKLEGQLPATLKNCTGLQILDVGGNMLSGKIPEWIGTHLYGLNILRLRNNQFHDVIPSMLCQASELWILDLGSNSLTGHIPHCFTNFSGMKFSGYAQHIYFSWYNNAYGVVSYVGFSQVLKGLQMEYKGALYLTNLDLSCNNLTGNIPWELTSLVQLVGLNLSFNHLEGEIPRMIGKMNSLESLDLSNNNLIGRIPESLSNLTFLEYLNLSNNDLSGKIPIGPQLRTLENPSTYGGNPRLCGALLPKRCDIDEAAKGSKAGNHVESNEDAIDKISLSAFVIGGFAVGLWGFIGILVFKRNWRYAYFQFVEYAIEKMVGH